MFIIFMDRISRHSHGVKRVWFGDLCEVWVRVGAIPNFLTSKPIKNCLPWHTGFPDWYNMSRLRNICHLFSAP